MYHVPVLLKESLEGLAIAKGKVYVDLTFGGGGHSREILSRLEEGKLIGFDCDEDAKKNAEAFQSDQFLFVESNFRNLKRFLKLYKFPKVDGILADLGVSSWQFDTAERGFTIRQDGPLDMRMDSGAGLTAEQVVNEYSQEDLLKILREYGEVSNAKVLAAELVTERARKPIRTTGHLVSLLSKFVRPAKAHKYYAQVFQALRIEVNDELTALQEMLQQATEVLNPGGRLVVISYHSLEDRLVKNYMKTGRFDGEAEKDFFGNLIRPLKPINSKPTTPSPEEVATNSRARSAKLRVAEKC
jgi:16S rRNA (cytosine1402-N4)-methyltransferase